MESESESKRCSKCGLVLPRDVFGKDKHQRDGLTSACTACRKAAFSKWYEANAEKDRAKGKEYREQNHEKELERYRRYAQENPDKIRAKSQKWREENRDLYNERMRQYRAEHPELFRQYEANRAQEKAEYSKQWREENKDRRNEYQRKHRQENPEWYRAWYEAHREQEIADAKRWRENNRERYNENTRQFQHKRRAQKLASGGTVTVAQWREVCEFYGNKCLCCGSEGVLLTVDHVIPLSRRGTHTVENVQPLCWPCNSTKHAKTIDYRPDKGAHFIKPNPAAQ